MKMLPEDMIMAWLRGDDKAGAPTWDKFATALERQGYSLIASKIRTGILEIFSYDNL